MKRVATCLALLLVTVPVTAGDDEGEGRSFEFGGHARYRLEAWESFGFGAPADPDDLFSVARLVAHADLRFNPRVRLFLQGKSAFGGGRSLPGGTRLLDEDKLALQQGFVDTRLSGDRGTRVTLRVGRQSLGYGRQRLVSPLPWANTLRAWDGVKLLVSRGAWNGELFWTRPVTIDPTDFNEPDDRRAFYGAHATRKSDALLLDTYAYGYERDMTVSFNGTSGPETRRTYGARVVWPAARRWTVETEAALQDGDVGSASIQAWMLTLEARWKPDCPMEPVLSLALDAASGDDAPGGDVETFDQLFPLGHAYFGFADVFGRQNVVSPSFALSVKPAERLHLRVGYHLFHRESDTDAVYTPGGGVLAAGAAGTSRRVGSEVDLVLTVPLDDRLTLELGAARVFAGRFLEQAGLDDDVSFVYSQLLYRF